MSSGDKCRECGVVIPSDSPGGYCAQCLLALGLEPVQESPENTATTRISQDRTEQSGDRIGRYQLLQEIGHGGCGVVYMAEQKEPVRRRVALKVIKLGMDTRQVVARFEAERQALALMDHPHIAKVLDAGTTELGRPYFVMELVGGIKITDYCDQNKLTTRQRLDLFIQVCHAIQHAHQKGIIHRDIKPSNILVALQDGVAVPKVIDFGIAKATQGRLTDQTLFTAFEQFIGTPAYMSPEQAEVGGLDVDTRSDIYALGILLYELLTGRTPFDGKELMAAGLEAIRRTIREKEPPRPSTRLSTMLDGELLSAAQHRQVEAPKLIKLVRGDLDWIVLKCLEKDRTRRYDTANGLAMDIQRHLSQEPVVARPPSTVYRVQKFVRRNRAVAMAAGVITTVLVLGVAISTWQAIRATRAEHDQSRLRGEAQAQQEANRLRAYASEVSVALQAWEAGNPTRARELLQRQRPKPGEVDLRGFEWRYLYELFRPREVATLHLQSGLTEVWGSAWSPDGKYIAMGVNGGKVELWDWATRTRLETIPARGMVYSVAFSPDGSKLAIPIETGVSTNKQVGVALWDLATHRITDQFVGEPGGYALGLTISRDGRLLAYMLGIGYNTATAGRIAVCDLTKQNAPFELSGHEASVLMPDFSPDNRWLVTPHGDGQILLWDLEHREIRERLVGHRGIVFFARFSPDGMTLATGGIDCTVRLWDLRGPVRIPITLGTHNSSVFGLDFSPNGKLLVSASLDHTAKVWDVAERKEVQTLRGHDQRVWSASFSPDGRLIMTGSEDSSVKIWRTPEAPADEPLDHHGSEGYGTLRFSSDGRWLMVSENRQTKLWEVASRKMVTLNLVHCRFSPDAKTLAGLNANGWLALGSLSNPPPRLVATYTNAGPFSLDLGLTFTPDGQNLVGIATNGDVSIWSPAGEIPHLLRTIPNTPGPNKRNVPVFAPDGQTLAIRTQGGALSIWNWREGRRITTLHDSASSEPIDSYSFSPDGRTLLTKFKGSMRLWDTAAWKERELIGDEYADVYHAFSTDSRFLATSGRTRTTVRLWNLASRSSEQLPSGSGPVDCVALSPDGRTLAVGTRDGWVNLWHLPSRQEIISLKAHRSHASSAVFSPDGRTLATAGSDGDLRLWTAPTFAETDAN